jgi:putative transposase
VSQSTAEIRIVPLPGSHDVLTEVLRNGAREMLARAIQAEVAAWIDDRAHLTDEAGRRQVVRNGSHPERTILTGLGPIEVKQPRVQDRRSPELRETFTPTVLPPYWK